jgi:hypothetical protein
MQIHTVVVDAGLINRGEGIRGIGKRPRRIEPDGCFLNTREGPPEFTSTGGGNGPHQVICGTAADQVLRKIGNNEERFRSREVEGTAKSVRSRRSTASIFAAPSTWRAKRGCTGGSVASPMTKTFAAPDASTAAAALRSASSWRPSS